jgi:micrococcal nuclease
MYEYKAKVVRVIDGDTVDLSIDLGFDVWISERVRLLGINCAEKNTTKGMDAKHYVESVLPVDSIVSIKTVFDKREKYGRVLGVLTLQDQTILNEALVSSGYAVKYDGKGPKENFVP